MLNKAEACFPSLLSTRSFYPPTHWDTLSPRRAPTIDAQFTPGLSAAARASVTHHENSSSYKAYTAAISHELGRADSTVAAAAW